MKPYADLTNDKKSQQSFILNLTDLWYFEMRQTYRAQIDPSPCLSQPISRNNPYVMLMHGPGKADHRYRIACDGSKTHRQKREPLRFSSRHRFKAPRCAGFVIPSCRHDCTSYQVLKGKVRQALEIARLKNIQIQGSLCIYISLCGRATAILVLFRCCAYHCLLYTTQPSNQVAMPRTSNTPLTRADQQIPRTVGGGFCAGTNLLAAPKMRFLAICFWYDAFTSLLLEALVLASIVLAGEKRSDY